MGGLSVVSFLINNPTLNIAGVLLTAPLLAMPEEHNIGTFKKLFLKAIIYSGFDNLVLNPVVPVHQVSNDRRIFY